MGVPHGWRYPEASGTSCCTPVAHRILVGFQALCWFDQVNLDDVPVHQN